MKTKPYNRHETFLAALSDSSISVPTPLSREELYLAKVAGENVTIPVAPYNRYETYLAKLAGQDVTVPTPASRLECYLYKACGYDCNEPVPANREEVFWKRYVGEEVSGSEITVADAVPGTPRLFVVTVVPHQDGTGTPTPDNVRDISGWSKVSITANGEDTPIYEESFTNTVYAGTVNVLTGNVTITHKLFSSHSTSGWANVVENKELRYNVPSDAVTPVLRAEGNVGWCDRFTVYHDLYFSEFLTKENATVYCASDASSYKRGFVLWFTYGGTLVNTIAKLKTFFDNGGAFNLVYKLDVPGTDTVTPGAITLTAGTNTFSANCGTITIKYTPDL